MMSIHKIEGVAIDLERMGPVIELSIRGRGCDFLVHVLVDKSHSLSRICSIIYLILFNFDLCIDVDSILNLGLQKSSL